MAVEITQNFFQLIPTEVKPQPVKELLFFPIEKGKESSPAVSIELNLSDNRRIINEDEERLLGVSTKPRLFENPWRISKKLTPSDINGLCRLMVKSSNVNVHIIPFWSKKDVAQIGSQQGVRVRVWDYGTESEYKMVLKRLKSSGCYIFNNGWSNNTRRNLKGDEIGLFWDSGSSRFGFRVLARNPKVI